MRGVGEDYVARARASWEAFGRGEAEIVDAWVAADVQWRPADGATLRGKEEIAAYLDEHLASLSPVAHDFERLGDCVIVRGSLRRFRDGGFLDVQPTWVFFFRRGLLVRVAAYGSRPEATQAVDRFAAGRAT